MTVVKNILVTILICIFLFAGIIVYGEPLKPEWCPSDYHYSQGINGQCYKIVGHEIKKIGPFNYNSTIHDYIYPDYSNINYSDFFPIFLAIWLLLAILLYPHNSEREGD